MLDQYSFWHGVHTTCTVGVHEWQGCIDRLACNMYAADTSVTDRELPTQVTHLNSCLRDFRVCVKSAASDSRGMTETPRNLSSEMKGFAACRVLEIWPLLPAMRTGRVEPLNFATGTTLSAPTLTCRFSNTWNASNALLF